MHQLDRDTRDPFTPMNLWKRDSHVKSAAALSSGKTCSNVTRLLTPTKAICSASRARRCFVAIISTDVSLATDVERAHSCAPFNISWTGGTQPEVRESKEEALGDCGQGRAIRCLLAFKNQT